MPQSSSRHAEPLRALRLASLCAAVTLAMLGLDFFAPPRLQVPLADAENYVQDVFARNGRFTPANTNLVLIGIDRPSYDDVFITETERKDPVLGALCERFPWSRSVWAALITRLADAGAKTIAIDLVFAASTDADPNFQAALDKYRDRVVIGANIAVSETDRGSPAQFTPPASSLIPDLPGQPAALDSRVGFINIWPDDNGVFRRARFTATNHQLGDVVNAPPATVVKSFDDAAVRQFGSAVALPAPGASPQIRFTGPPGTWPVIPSEATWMTPVLWRQNFGNGKFFAGKLVVVGPTANIFQDFHRTPFRREMPGPEIHLQIINAALHGEFLPTTPPLASGALVALAGLLGAMLCQLIRAPVSRLAVILLASLGFFFAAKLGFDHAGVLDTGGQSFAGAGHHWLRRPDL